MKTCLYLFYLHKGAHTICQSETKHPRQDKSIKKNIGYYILQLSKQFISKGKKNVWLMTGGKI